MSCHDVPNQLSFEKLLELYLSAILCELSVGKTIVAERQVYSTLASTVLIINASLLRGLTAQGSSATG